VTPEESARETIDELLTAAGWVVQDRGSANLSAGCGVAVRELSFSTGEPDYTLFVGGKAAGVLEAKPEGHSLVGVSEQTAKYVVGLPDGIPAWRNPLPFALESTGSETQFLSRLDPEPRSRSLFAFHRPGTLLTWAQEDNPLNQRLREMPGLITDHLWRAQVQAITNLERSLAANKPRALIQMATGSGKTFTAVNACYRLVKFAKARRILFLVDRGNLGEQTLKEFQQFTTPDDGRKFTELYNVQHLTSNALDLVANVTIATIQRLYSMLKGDAEPAPDLDDQPIDAAESLFAAPPPVAYNAAIPIETFDFIITDECHRSIYNLWRQVLEYFDAYLIGLTATPSKQTLGFFHQNLVMEYGHERAVADGVNVNYDVYRIRTKVTEQGATVEKGYYVDRRDRLTRRKRWEQLDDDLTYVASQLDRDVVSESQIRTVLEAFKAALFTELFPGRNEVPKTLIFAKDDSHADDIVRICREVFDKGNEFCQKITYRTTGTPPRDLIQSFRNSYNPRIAVTVDMIATGTDIKPLEVVFFMRSVRSQGFFEQMKGRGVRVISDTEFQGVTPGAKRKTHFVIVDAVGVCEQDKSDSRPLERKRQVSFEQLLQAVALGNREAEVLESLAGRLLRLDRLLDDRQTGEVKRLTGGANLAAIARGLLEAVDPDAVEAKAKEHLIEGAKPTDRQLKAAAQVLANEAAKALAANPALRGRLVEIHRTAEQTIDTVTIDEVVSQEYDELALEKARGIVQSWEAYIAEHRDEITAIQLLYTHSKRLRYEQLKDLAAAIQAPPRNWTPDALWEAYEKLRGSAERPVKPTTTAATHILADLVALVRVALHETCDLVPRRDDVERRYQIWLGEQTSRGRAFTPEQQLWLNRIKEHIATSLAIDPADFDLSPFAQEGGLGRAAHLFGGDFPGLLDELNEVLAA
jgi:type I restriction enzyme, R subunit